jgi:Lrp/AsnC family leucine-responsive transcriptional regulator
MKRQTTRVTTVLDEVDVALLGVLQQEGRESVSSLAERVGISRATAYSRLEALEEEGVVRGYAAQLDHEAAGMDVTAIVLLSGGQRAWKPLQELLKDLPQVEKAWYVTGMADVLLVVRVRDVAELRALVLERLRTLPDVRSTQTMLAIEQVVDRAFVLPSAP